MMVVREVGLTGRMILIMPGLHLASVQLHLTGTLDVMALAELLDAV